MAIELAADTESAPPLAHRMVILFEDNLATGEIEVEAHLHPPEVNLNSPAHVVGMYLRDNIEQIVLAAQHEWARKRRLNSTHLQLDLFKPNSQLDLAAPPARVITVDSTGRVVEGVPHGA